MSKELRAAIEKMTDQNWSFLKAVAGDDSIGVNPEGFTRGESTGLRLASHVLPDVFLAVLAGQFLDQTQRTQFEELLNS